MIAKDISNSVPWLFPNLENYSHLLLNLKFKSKSSSELGIPSKKFFLRIEINGFEGLLLYIYNISDSLKFDLLNNPIDVEHQLNFTIPRRFFNSNENFYLCLIPFGFLKTDHKIIFSSEMEDFNVIKQLYAWCPSFLFRNIKSIIKINNSYEGVLPKFEFPTTNFHLENWFKSNETSAIFNLINLISKLESMDYLDFKVNSEEVKNLINKTNEYLFEIVEHKRPLDPSFILTELIRLRNNIEFLSKKNIVNWLNDIINYYSKQTQENSQ